jgi:Tol biopolymer transport system component
VLSLAVSRQGGRLAYADGQGSVNIWRVELEGRSRKPRGVPLKLMATTRWDIHPAYSPDGSRIAFRSTRSGSDAIWLCKSDGSNPVQLISIKGSDIMGPRWSPNGQSIAFTAFPQHNEDIFRINTNGGAPRRLTSHPAADAWPYWSQDGQWLYFRSSRSRSSGEIWKMPSSGGEAVQITRNGGDYPQESPDGRFVYYEKGWPSHCTVWRMPVEGGEETKVLDGVHPYGKWAVAKEGIYFFIGSGDWTNKDICFYEFATGQTTKVLTIKECNPDDYIAVSPDGLTILFPQVDQVGSDLMLVENFR